MPLRAVLDGADVFGFSYSQEDWQALKQTYRNCVLVTHCCGNKAIPKTSRLGTHFFAHARRGECSTAPETPEHLYLKSIFAQAAERAGWEAQAEVFGATPAGKAWIADVLCCRGDTRFAVEIQWSMQSTAELELRHSRYLESNLRTAWIYRLNGTKKFWSFNPQHPSTRQMPTFGIKYRKESRQLFVPQFDLDIEPFAEALMSGRVQCRPIRPRELLGGVIAVADQCWRCHKETAYIAGLVVEEDGHHLAYLSLTEDGRVAEAIAAQVPAQIFMQHGIAPLKKRWSKTVGQSYIANACSHCQAMSGAFYHRELEYDLHISGYPKPIFLISLPSAVVTELIKPRWYISSLPASAPAEVDTCREERQIN